MAIATGRLRRLSGGRLGKISRYLTVAAGSAGARLSSFLATVIIARSLGPSGFGDFSLFFALLVPFSMATQFLDVTYVRQANTPGSVDRGILLRASVVLKAHRDSAAGGRRVSIRGGCSHATRSAGPS